MLTTIKCLYVLKKNYTRRLFIFLDIVITIVVKSLTSSAAAAAALCPRCLPTAKLVDKRGLIKNLLQFERLQKEFNKAVIFNPERALNKVKTAMFETRDYQKFPVAALCCPRTAHS